VLFLDTSGTVSGSPVKITQGSGGFDGTIQVAGETKEDSFGVSITRLGDLDNDGAPEIAVGEGRDDRGDASNIDAGALWIFSLASNGHALPGAVKHDGTDPRLLPYSFAGNRFGRPRGARVSDLDGDGVPELLVGTLGTTGYALLYLDTDKSAKAVEAWSDVLGVVPELQGANFVASSEIGDLDGDGRPEIAMGPGGALDDDGGTDRGAVYVLYPDAIPVPEPGAALGLVSGSLLLAALNCRRKRAGR
jgi:hypothetical protein